VPGADGHVDRLTLVDGNVPVAHCGDGTALDDDPVFLAVLICLQREPRSKDYVDPLVLVAVVEADQRARIPGSLL